MRIAYINRLLNEPRGCGLHARSLVKAWLVSGHEVLCLPEAVDYASDARASASGRYSFLPGLPHAAALDVRGRVWSRRIRGRLTRNIAAFAPDVVIARRAPYDYALDSVARHIVIPYVAEVNAILADEALELAGKRVLSWERAREEAYLLGAAGAICVSEELMASLVRLGLSRAHVAVVPNGVDLALFSRNAAPDRDVREWASRFRVVYAYVGTLSLTHDTSGLLRCVSRVSDQQPDAGFLFVGPLLKTLQQDPAWRDGLQGRVMCTGPVPHERVPACVRCADICWASFRNNYGSPLKLYEYMAMGKPVVVAATGQPATVVNDSGCGTVVARGDTRGLCTAAVALGGLTSDGLQAIGDRGRRWAEKNCSWSGTAEHFLDSALAMATDFRER